MGQPLHPKKACRFNTSFGLHRWDVNIPEALEIQEQLRARVSLRNGLSFAKIRRIAGADVAYAADGESIFGTIVLLRFPELVVTEGCCVQERTHFPYVPGLLSFREAPVLLKAYSLLKQLPDVIFFDGQGIAHPRGFGLASHAGLLLGVPAIGCAKTRLVGEYPPVAAMRGSVSWLSFGGQRVGAVVRTRTDVRPLFVSPGYRITLSTAVRLVLDTSHGYRLPEPARKAHQLANRMREKQIRGFVL